MCEYCGDYDRKHYETGKGMEFKRQLKEGAMGSKLVDWFQHNLGITPVDAEYLDRPSKHETNYRITFDDESVADYKVTFEPKGFLIIADIEEYNRVI